MTGSGALIAVLLGLLAAAAGVAWWLWRELADVEMGWHGWAALGLGVVATAGLGMGLMFLVYYSSQHGYDDEAGRD